MRRSSRERESLRRSIRAFPNPVAEILKLKDTLQLSAVQIVELTDVADTLQAKNGRLYRNIRTLLAKSQEAGDKKQMAGSVAMMLEEASAIRPAPSPRLERCCVLSSGRFSPRKSGPAGERHRGSFVKAVGELSARRPTPRYPTRSPYCDPDRSGVFHHTVILP